VSEFGAPLGVLGFGGSGRLELRNLLVLRRGVFVLPERAQPDQFGAQQGAPEQPLVAWFDAERAGEADQDLEASESDGPSRGRGAAARFD
jgi:hypothetical protein